MKIIDINQVNSKQFQLGIITLEKTGSSVANGLKNFLIYFTKYPVFNKFKCDSEFIHKDLSLKFAFATYLIENSKIESFKSKDKYILTSKQLSTKNVTNNTIISHDEPFSIEFFKENVTNNHVEKNIVDSEGNVYFVHKPYLHNAVCTVSGSFNEKNEKADRITLDIYFNYEVNIDTVKEIIKEYNLFVEKNYFLETGKDIESNLESV